MSVTGVIVAAVIVGCTGCLMGFFPYALHQKSSRLK